MDIKASIEKILPLISQYSTPVATALGMPYAGVVISALCHLFGVKTADDLPGAIQTDPDVEVKVKQIEAQIASMQAKSQVQENEIQDRASARQMSSQASDRKDWIIHYLAFTISLGFFAYVIAYNLGFIQFDKEIFHNLVVMTTIVLMYYF